MKSIPFTVLKEKLLSKTKTQTFRTTFIPKMEIGEIVNIDYKENGIRETLYPARITDIYPKQVKNLTLEEAKRDGFKTIKEFQQKIIELNKIKSMNQWGFIIRFKKCPTILEYSTDREVPVSRTNKGDNTD